MQVTEGGPRFGVPAGNAMQQLDDVDLPIEFSAVRGTLALLQPGDESGVVEAGGAGSVRGARHGALGFQARVAVEGAVEAVVEDGEESVGQRAADCQLDFPPVGVGAKQADMCAIGMA
jgi:hypothetical protein